MLRRDCRHRLGSTVGGAFSSERKPYGSRLQTTLPCAEVIRAFSSVPRKPRAASSKSRVSENGSAFSVAACRATTVADASLGASVLAVSVMLPSLTHQKIDRRPQSMPRKFQILLRIPYHSLDLFYFCFERPQGYYTRGLAIR